MIATPDDPRGAEQSQDPSMEEILASIRRIMLDEQARLKGAQDGQGEAGPQDGDERDETAPVTPALLVLDDSMAVRAPETTAEPAATPPAERFSGVSTEFRLPAFHLVEQDAYPAEGPAQPAPVAITILESPAMENAAAETTGPAPSDGERGTGDRGTGLTPREVQELLAPAVAAAASSSVEALLRQLEAERQASLQGPLAASITIEEAVRSELRPMLKAWLDEHLPDIVERVVKAEIARLTFRHSA
jgi:cell pole-organizing protein PopZ